MSQSTRLRGHAAKYHGLAHKSVVIATYSAKAEEFDRADMCRHAAHVASWIAYGPEGRIPKKAELQLLEKFLGRLGGGRLPSRLREVLPDAQEALRALPPGGLTEAWQEAAQQLRRSLQKLRCCRQPEDKAVPWGANEP